MQSKQTMKRLTLIALLSLILATASSTLAAPPAQAPESVECGDSITCSTAGNAVYVQNSGTGPTIYGENTSTGDGLKGRGNPGVYGFSYHAAGVRGKSNQGIGVRGESVDKYGVAGYSDTSAGVWARGHSLGSDLVLAGNNATFSDGVISSDPDYPSSDFWIMGQDDVHIVLDTEDDETGQFDIYSELYGGDVVMKVEENGEMYIADDLHLDFDGGSGEIFATGASNSRLYLYSNSWADLHIDENGDEAVTCFNVFGSGGLLWQVCESKGTTAVGSQAVAVETSSGAREMYAMGSPGLWFEDFGSAALVDGQARVEIDTLFAETVNLDADYQVYLTPVSSEAVLLFVTEKTPAAFNVQGVTLDGSPASASFDYRIVAKRLNYENQRLEQVDLTPPVELEP
jgi:hypothetical protein